MNVGILLYLYRLTLHISVDFLESLKNSSQGTKYAYKMVLYKKGNNITSYWHKP